MVENEGLKREIGTWGLVANSVNIIIGAGIFILPVLVAERLGTGSILAYVICGLLMLMIMLCFVEVGSKITITGGAYSYIENAFGRFSGFLTTTIFIFGAAIMANAAVANGLADTLSYFLPVFRKLWIRIIFFAIVFGGLGYFNVRGLSKAMAIVKFNTIAKMVPLLMIVICGWFFIRTENLNFTFGNSIKDIGEVSLILLFAFVGAETALNVSGEIKKPEKTIPKGIIISVLLVVVIYLLVQVVVQAILGETITEHRDAPLAATARIMFGSAGALIVVIGAGFSMFGNISGMVLNMPRILFAAARDRVLPSKTLARIHPVFRTPWVAIVTYSALGFIFASIGEFKQLAMLSSASYLIIYLGVVFSVIKFRLTGNREPGLYRIPGGYIIPVITAVAIIWVLSNLPVNELTAMGIFILLISAVYQVVILTGRRKQNS
ncbi:MAG: APC family permease [Bacteroidota bacterium]|nr:APC family permease [Bacteroidota bacterium]